MKPLYDELSLPISITITDREHIFRWARTHRSHERFTRPKWDPSERYPSSADCTTATNDGLPERARIKPCRYWLSDFLVRRVLAHRCTSQRIWFTRFKQGPQAHRPLRFVWRNNFDPWALRIFGRHRSQHQQIGSSSLPPLPPPRVMTTTRPLIINLD